MFVARMKIALVLFVTCCSIQLDIALGFGAEVRSQCHQFRFSCDGGRNCIPKRWLCDGDPDCRDGSDELISNCEVKLLRNCTVNEFTCANSKCVPKTWRCDGAADCDDNSDEADCSSVCGAQEFQCANGQCISARWRCDRFKDCSDGSDERNCTSAISEITPEASSGNTTLDSNQNSTSLELEGGTSTPSPYFFCTDGHRLPNSYVCDGDKDCVEGEDEQNCSGVSTTTSAPRCTESEFQCSPGYCVPKRWLCDGTADCPAAQDERNCPNKTCSSLQFECSSSKECIAAHQRCNGFFDCRDQSDEQDCEAESSASPAVAPISPSEGCNSTTHFQCTSGRCILRTKLCDKKNDCGNNQDESVSECGADECERNNGGCEHQCVNTREGHHCLCNKGYRLIGKYSCEDINECEEVPGSCSQLCVNTRGSFHCSCQPGYLRDPRDYTRCKAAVGEAYLIFSHSYDIRSIRLRDSDMTSVVSDTHGATALDFHYQTNQIFWSDRKEKKIFRADMSNTRSRVTVAEEEVAADGLAVDWVHKQIYYTDTKNFAVRMVSWDSKWTKTLVKEGLEQPRAIVVSPLTGYVYWSDWGRDPKIERAGLDGSSREAIVSSPDVVWPNGITIDHSNNRLYWCDGRLNTISAAKLDGSHVETILYSPQVLRLPYSITVFEDRLYWTDWSRLALYSANKFTGEDIRNVSAGHMLESPKVVHVFHQYRQPNGENLCFNHSCSHMCVRSTVSTPLCTCPDGFRLTEDGTTCREDEAAEMIPEKAVEFISPQRPSSSSSQDDNTIYTTASQKDSTAAQNANSQKRLVPKESISVTTSSERPSSDIPPETGSTSVQRVDQPSRVLPTPATAVESSDETILKKAELVGVPQDTSSTPQSSLGLILAIVVGLICLIAVGGAAMFLVFRRRRQTVKRFRFHNPVYRKTTDEDDSDGRGFTIAQEQLFYNPTREYGPPDPTLTMTEEDDAPLTPEDDNSGV